MRFGFAWMAVAVVLAPVMAVAGDAGVKKAPGVYLRLDSGYSFARDSAVHQDSTALGTVQGDAKLGEAWIADGGVGYRFNEYLRVDGTIGYRGGYTVKSTTLYNGSLYSDRADLDSRVGLISAYWDIWTLGRVFALSAGA